MTQPYRTAGQKQPHHRCQVLQRLAAVLMAGLITGHAGGACAQTYPARPVHILSVYPSGAGPDLVARMFADKLSRLWNQPVTVEAKPGANGFIALENTRRAAPDGHTLLVVGDSHMTLNPSLFRNVPYDPEADFTPIAMQFRTPFFVAVSATGPYRTVADLLGALKARPGRISVGMPYIGSPAHLGAVSLEQALGTTMIHVPFKENAALFASLSNGDIDWLIGTIASAGAFYKSGRLRFLAVIARSRLASHPDIPTLAEEGGPASVAVGAWVAFVGPRDIAPEVVNTINRSVGQVLADDDFRQRMAGFGFLPTASTPQELADTIRTDLARNAETIRRAGIKAD